MDNFITFFTFVLFIIFTARFTVTNPSADNVTSHFVDNSRTEPEKTANNLTPHTNFSKFHPINRHFNDKHPKRPKQIGTRRRSFQKNLQYRISGGNDGGRSESFRGEGSTNWLKIKRDYDSRVIKTKNVIDREKLKDLIREKKQMKREEENVLMKSIRKFLKHSFVLID